MNGETGTQADDPTSGRREKPTVFVLGESDADTEVLRASLEADYRVVVPEGDPDFDASFDVCLLDDRSLARYADALERWKERARPVFLPYVLLTGRSHSDTMPERVWQQVDDVVHKPVASAALSNRLTSHMRTRTLSIQFARSEARFAALIRTATDAIFIVDDTGSIVFVNPAVESVLGYDPSSIVGQSVTVLIPERFRERASGGIRRAFAADAVDSAEPLDSIEVRALHQDGYEVPVLLSYNQFRTDGRTFLAGIVHDISEAVRREQRLRVLNRVLRHDIRNDVNVIQGWAERLRLTGQNVPQYTRYIEEKTDEIVHLSTQARQVEELTRAGDDALRPLDIVSRLEEQLNRLRRDNPTVELHVDVPERADVVAVDLIDSAIDNVLQNAVEHNVADQPTVDVVLSDDSPNTVELRIVDNGPGLPAEELVALRTGDEGPLTHTSGLGLWITKWIVTESGGTVRFEENEPSGTAVSMTLPKAAPDTG